MPVTRSRRFNRRPAVALLCSLLGVLIITGCGSAPEHPDSSGPPSISSSSAPEQTAAGTPTVSAPQTPASSPDASATTPAASPTTSAASPTTAAVSAARSSSRAPASSPAASATTSAAAAGGGFHVCPAVPGSDIHALSDCLHADLVRYWEAATRQQIDRPVVIEPKFPPEPRSCYAPQTLYAYYCPDNGTIYLNTSLLTLWDKHFAASEVPYSLALTLAHEMGHAAQFAVDPAPRHADTSVPATSTRIELQADCLAGVWAHSEVAGGRLDRDRLLEVWHREVVLLDTAEHRRTHGSPDARVASTRKGLATGDPATCGLRFP